MPFPKKFTSPKSVSAIKPLPAVESLSVSKLPKMEITFTGIVDADTNILYKLSMSDLKNLSLVNKYVQNILNNRWFCKNRLELVLRLTSDKDFNYKFLNEQLDNGKSFSENFLRALDVDHTKINYSKYPQIIRILMKNKKY